MPINQLINKGTREKVLESIEKLIGEGFMKNLEFKPERKVYFCVVYENKRDGLKYEKEYVKRLFKGEKIEGRHGNDVHLVFGYGTLLGINHKRTAKGTSFNQYIIYNIVVLKGRQRDTFWSAYHESWIKLGEWVNKNGLHFEKERVVFT